MTALRSLRHFIAAAVCVAATLSIARAVEPPAVVSKLVSTHCLDCHSGSSAEAGLDLSTLGTDLNNPEQFAKWVRIHDRVRDGEMPPSDFAELSRDEAKRFLESAGDWLLSADRKRQEKFGRVGARRLTNLQLARTLQDLLGIDLPLIDRVPEEMATGGFTTVADGQTMSHFHLENHLKVVDAALDEAWKRAIEGDDVWKRKLSAKELSRTRDRTREPEFIDGHAVVWSSRLIFYGRIPATTARESGWYRFTIKAHSLKSDEPVWTTVRTGPCVSSAPLLGWVGAFEAPKKAKTVTFETWLPKGHMLEIRPGDGTLKMARFEGGQSANGEGGAQDVPGIAIEFVEMERFHGGPDAEGVRELLFDDLELKKDRRNAWLVSDDPNADAARLIKRFAKRAFRRPVNDAEVAPYVAAVTKSIEAGDDLIDALKLGYRALLCSPRFLYFYEEPGELDDYAIASRLSYLLWNRMPDPELMKLAEAGRLRDRKVLRQHVERMLNDPRGKDFVPDFAAQWLDLSQIDFTEPDRRMYPDFDIIVQHSMLAETHTFLQAMLDNDLSVSHLIDADYTYLNSRLARFYKIEGVTGDELQRVQLKPEHHRGGLITHGAILKVTANGTTTSPVIRGVWMCERLLGEHIPPPPESVAAIEPDIRGATTIREMLDKHKSDASCASCHVKIDPPGFALENFDPAGQWREHYIAIEAGRRKRGLEIDASYTLTDGRHFDGIDEFRSLVAADRERLARNVAEKLITYGTGAAPSFADREPIARIVKEASGSGYGFRALLHAVVSSPVFLSK